MANMIYREGSLDWFKIVLVLFAGIIIYRLLRVIYNVSPLHPLSSYPGPLLWRASRLPWIFSLNSGYLHQDIIQFHERYGPVVRVAPNELSYTDARAWKDIYAPPTASTDSEPAGLLERNPTWFRKAKPTDPWSIMGPNEAAHTRYKRAFMGAFTDKALRDHAHVLEDYVSLFINKLREKAKHSKSIDLVSWFNFLTFDISGVLSFGESFKSTESGHAHPWVAISCGFGKGIAIMASLNFLGLTSGPVARLLKFIIPKAAREKMVYHRELTEQKVAIYLESSKTTKDRAAFIDAALHFNESAKTPADIITKAEFDMNMSILIFAGSETTSSALSAITRYLLQNPTCLSKLTDEIRTSFPTEDEITVATTSKLPYLTACINESLRLGPPVVIGVPRVAPKGGAWICDRLVPEGTFVVVNQYPIHRSPTNFSSPNTFDPERFLNPSPDDDLSAFNPFSLGRHNCIGQKLACAELRLILTRLLFAFDVELVGERPGKTEAWDWVKQKTFIFWEKEPLMVKLSARS